MENKQGLSRAQKKKQMGVTNQLRRKQIQGSQIHLNGKIKNRGSHILVQGVRVIKKPVKKFQLIFYLIFHALIINL